MKLKLAAVLFAAFACAATFIARAAEPTTVEGRAGAAVVVVPAKELWYCDYAKDAAGNWRWKGYWQIAGKQVYAARIVVADGAAYFQRVDGTWFDGKTGAAAADPRTSSPPVVTPPPVPLPPVAMPPAPPTAPPPPTGARVVPVYAVPVVYDPPAVDAGGAYALTLAKVTDAAGIAANMAKVKEFFARETYGFIQLDVTVLPARRVNKPVPSCDGSQMRIDAGNPPAIAVILPTYACWNSYGVSGGDYILMWGTHQDQPGNIAHEIGHSLGFGHSASAAGVYTNNYDVMGNVYGWIEGQHLNAIHKWMLRDATGAFGKALTPMPCKSATLRPLETYPDAIRCGTVWAELHGGDGKVWIHSQGWQYGGDNNLEARLAAGQSYKHPQPAYTFKHVGNGVVTVTP